MSNEQYDVQDLTDVKADKNLFPVTKDLKVRINAADTQMNKNKNIYALKLELRTVEPTEVGEGNTIKANYPLFTGLMDLVYGADLTVDERGENKWWKNNQHLVEFKNFLKALDMPLAGIKVNDQWLSDLIGRELLVSVLHEANKVADPETGKKVATGDFSQKLKNWKKA